MLPPIGIDWGTTNSCISYYNTNLKCVQVIPNEHGKLTSPSILFLDSESPEILYSNSALQLYYKSTNSQNYLRGLFYNLKRLVGNKLDDNIYLQFFKHNIYNSNTSEFTLTWDNKEQNIHIIKLLVFYFRYLRGIVLDHFSIVDKNISIDIVLTVPVYFNDNQRTILKQCCESVNFNVLRIINEPTAASLAYALENSKYKEEEEFILTFDCGGGTTDISLLHLDYIESIYEVKNTIGDNLLGGEDITNNLINYVISKLGLQNSTKNILNKIRKQAEEVKIQLSFNKQATFYVELGDKDYTLIITQAQFNEINKNTYQKIRNLIYCVLDEYMQKCNTFNYSKINSVIFVGGTSQIPYFKSLFQSIFPNAIINNTIDPDQTISIGASIQGALLKDLLDESNGKDTLLLDIIPLSIGIETIGGIMTPIISRNTPLPISRTQTFTNSNSFEECIIINIYQGERKLVKDNSFLASFKLSSPLLAKYEKGQVQIKLTIHVDSNSIIHAKATAKIDSEETITSNIQVTKTYNTPIDIDDMSYELNKITDTEMANKILAKIELYDSFKYLLSVFHEKALKQNKDNETNGQKYDEYALNELFNKTFTVIQNYMDYSAKELCEIKCSFEKNWHILLFSNNIILKNKEGQIIEFGGSQIN
jgi:molecular chaperone DnaK (HSP70)